MPRQSSLFDDDPLPGASPNAPGAAVVLSAWKFSGGTLSAQQKRFNQLLERTEMLAGRIDAARALADAHRIACGSALRPLEVRRNALMREMALWLDTRAHRPGLTRRQRQMTSDIIRDLALALVLTGMEDMRALHDAHGDTTLEEEERAGADDARALLEQLLGQRVGGAEGVDSPEEALRAGIDQMFERERAHAEERAAHQARRRKTGRRPQGEQDALHAEGALRTIYRQLASALHPDRETDPAAHARKTTLMSEANAAYARRDLPALLQLQLRAELADAGRASALANEKIAGLTALLKERAEVLARELAGIEHEARAEFDLPPFVPFAAAALRRHLQELKQGLLAEIALMQRDLRRVQTDGEFKQWLREQHRSAREADRFSPF